MNGVSNKRERKTFLALEVKLRFIRKQQKGQVHHILGTGLEQAIGETIRERVSPSMCSGKNQKVAIVFSREVIKSKN